MLTSLTMAQSRARVCGGLALATSLVALIGVELPDGAAKFATLAIFALLGPGSAAVAWWNAGDDAAAWLTVAMTLSLSICGAVATVMIWLSWWHPAGAFAGLAAVTAGTGMLASIRSLGGRR